VWTTISGSAKIGRSARRTMNTGPMPHPTDPDWDLIDCRSTHLVGIGWPGGAAKICKIQFHNDGYFVHFPYHPATTGLVAFCNVRAGDDQIRLAEHGGVVSHAVKYSHHGDGRCHFSQDGKVKTAGVTIDGRNLLAMSDDQADHIFSIDAEGFEQFKSLSEAERTSDTVGRAFAEIQSGGSLAAHIVGRWHRAPDIDAIPNIRNPITVRNPQGGMEQALALSPPLESPLFGHLMTLTFRTREPLRSSNDEFLLLFTGGFAPNLDDPDIDSSCLVMTYPADALAGLPSFDYQP